MAATRLGRPELEFYRMPNTDILVRAGDVVLMKSAEYKNFPSVARVEGVHADKKGNVRVRVRWYILPEEAGGGRRQFHGRKELFLSDRYDVEGVHTIQGTCRVHSFDDYTKLDRVDLDDYFCRFEYNTTTNGFTPDQVTVYCMCEMPLNPDEFMLQCEACQDWYHPVCIKMTHEQARATTHYTCAECESANAKKRPSPAGKVATKRRRT